MVGQTGGPASSASTPIAPAGSPAPSSHPIQHVVVVYLENEGVSAVDKYGPYERYLGATYGNITEMYSACHPSMANYIAALAAVTNDCGSDSWYNFTNASLGDLISGDHSNAFTWAQFAENVPSNICANPDQSVGEFAVRHVPFLFFRNVTKNESYCKSHVLGSTYFNGTSGNEGITSTNFVNFSFYSPNLCDDGHDTCGSVPPQCASISGSKVACQEVTQADNWLRGFLGPRLNSSNPVEENNVNHTMFIVTWDEDGNPTTYTGYSVPGITSGNNYQACKADGAPAGYAVCGGHIYGLVVDHYNRGIAPMNQKAAAYGIAATVEWLFNLQGTHGTGLDNYGEYDYLYRTTSPGFPTFASISGITDDGYGARYTVTFTETGLPSGTSWSVTLNGTPHISTTTQITFSEPNGTYAFTVGSVNGYKASPSSGSVTLNGAPASKAITFTSVSSTNYTVTFSESGLPSGTSWSVKLNGSLNTSTTTTITFMEPNGTYPYAITDISGWHQATIPYTGTVTVAGKAVTEPTLAFTQVTYSITFTESGLPSGTEWWVNLTDGPTFSSTTDSLSFVEPNGTYDYTAATADKVYAPTVSGGSFGVSGAPVGQSVTFNRGTYPVTFTETGLPSGTTWYVNGTAWGSLSATVVGTLGTSVSASLTNGTYSFTVASANKTWAPAYTSPFVVNGGRVSVPVTFTEVTSAVTFTESGLPSGTTWYVNLTDGQSNSSTGSTIGFLEPNGTYDYSVATTDKKYSPTVSGGSFGVNGAQVGQSVTFSLMTYTVTFTENGLPSGTEWWVNVTGQPSQSSTTTTITLNLLNETYTYAIATTDKSYRAPGGAFTVNGAVVSKSVTFSPVTYTVTFTETGLPSGTEWWVNLSSGQSFFATGSTLTFSEANGTYSYSVSALGYSNATGSLTVSGPTAAPVTVSFSSSASSSSSLPTLDYLIIGVVVVVVAIGLAVVLIRRRG
ncbi:MAG: hypothetical protein ABSA63_04485 [Thermoplasmata archaeon]